VLGEYAGLFMPLQYPDELEPKRKRDYYSFDFPGPLEHDNSGREKDTETYITCLTSQLRGNWTRFINQGKDSLKGNNCQFDDNYVTGKHRGLIVSTKAINLGNKLSVWYRPNYFDKDKEVNEEGSKSLAQKAIK
jgi:hypothetical protein